MEVFSPEQVAEFVDSFFVRKVPSGKLEAFFQGIVETGYEQRKAELQNKFRKGGARYVRQYTFISQIMTFVDAKLESFYHFAKPILSKRRGGFFTWWGLIESNCPNSLTKCLQKIKQRKRGYNHLAVTP
jgi:hypothetical protein